ncbi:HAD family hydrolase [Actinotalea solisilvae]|uniref:HAD family hydrolase n=1 Tax=Actinotalea solisilvae TaxID=2072922 RepID=UPI0018F1E94B|nr:HAD family phosphatase [Actinotalea solisilvae]
MTVDAVLFDLGQVLVRWDPWLPFRGRHPEADVRRFFDEVDFAAFNHRQDAGRPWAEARAELEATHPQHVGLLDVYVEHFAEAVPGPVEGADALVDDLRAAGVRVLGLTNWSAETFHVAPTTAPVVGRLEDVLVSGREGLAKPDPRIFGLATRRFGLDPARTLFTDDAPVNVDAAARAGFRTELFTSHDALRGTLRALGVEVPASPRAPGT